MQQTVQSSVQFICTSALLCTGAVSEATLDIVRQTVQYSVQVIHSYVLSRRYKLYNTLHRAVDAALLLSRIHARVGFDMAQCRQQVEQVMHCAMTMASPPTPLVLNISQSHELA